MPERGPSGFRQILERGLQASRQRATEAAQQIKPIVENLGDIHAQAAAAAYSYLDEPHTVEVTLGTEGRGKISLTRREAVARLVGTVGLIGLAKARLGMKGETVVQSVDQNPPPSTLPVEVPAVLVSPSPLPASADVFPSPAAIAIESQAAKDRREAMAKELVDQFPIMPSQENLEPSTLPFLDNDANEVAAEIGVTHVGQLFNVPEVVFPHLTAWLTDEDLKIESPAVDTLDPIFEAKAKEHGVSKNLLKILALIESGGDARAGEEREDGSDGQGLMQVESINFPDGTTQEEKFDPAYNLDRAITQVIQAFERAANSTDPTVQPEWVKNPSDGYKKSESYKWLRIAQAFNKGNDAFPYQSAYDQRIPSVGRVYFGHVLRFAILAEVNSRLQKRGFTAAQASAKTSSYEGEARAHALGKALENHPTSDFDYYQKIIRVLGQPRIDQTQGQAIDVKDEGNLFDSYHSYLKKTNGGVRSIQVNPAIEIWLNHDPTRGIWKRINSNNDLYAWQESYGMNSWRPKSTPVPVETSVPTPKPESKPKPEAPRPETKKKEIPEEYMYEEQDEQWWQPPVYNPKKDKQLTCGPTSVADVVSTLLEKDVTPTQVDTELIQRKLRTPGGLKGTTFREGYERNENGQRKWVVDYEDEGGAVALMREKYGLQVDALYDAYSTNLDIRGIRLQEWKDAIEDGKLIIASASNAMFLSKDENGNNPKDEKLIQFPDGADHIFVIENLEKDSKGVWKFTVVDSWDGKRKKNIPLSDLRNAVYAYAVSR
jgi:hypothetical protein